MSDRTDQIKLARKLSDILVYDPLNTTAIDKLIEDGRMAKTFKDVIFTDIIANGSLVVDADEKVALADAGFSDEFIDELVGKNGKKLLYERVKLIAPFCVPTTLTLFRYPVYQYFNLIDELAGYGRDAADAVPYLLRALDDEDYIIRYRAFLALAETGAPKEVFVDIADICKRVRNIDIEAGLVPVFKNDCEEAMIKMFDNSSAGPEEVFSAMEYYFRDNTDYKNGHTVLYFSPEPFVAKLVTYGEKAVPFALKLLNSGQELVALMILSKLDYKSEELKPRLKELYQREYPSLESVFEGALFSSWATKRSTGPSMVMKYAARLLVINGEETYALDIAYTMMSIFIWADCLLEDDSRSGPLSSCSNSCFSVFGADIFDSLIDLIRGKIIEDAEKENEWLNYLAYEIGPSAGKIAGKLVKYINSDNERVAHFALKCIRYAGVGAIGTFDKVFKIALDENKDIKIRYEAIYAIFHLAILSGKNSLMADSAMLFSNDDMRIVEKAVVILYSRMMNYPVELSDGSRFAYLFLPYLSKIIIEKKFSAETLQKVSEIKDAIEKIYL